MINLRKMLKFVISIAACSSFFSACRCGAISESKFFYDFIRSVDPENVLEIDHHHGNFENPCLLKINGVKCNLQPPFIREIRLENLNLSGKFDTGSLCELSQLKVLSLAKNRIEGMIPESISKCKSLEELDLSYNSLKGSIPSSAISSLRSLKKFNISGNSLVGVVTNALNEITQNLISSENSQSENLDSENKKKHGNWILYILVAFVVMAFLLVSIFFILKNKKKRAEDEEIIKVTVHSPAEIEEDVKQENKLSELVFFVEEEEQFELEDLLEATTHLRRQGLCSSLYKVKLKHNAIFAVKRLKKLQVSFGKFGETMRKIGSLKHENILPLVAYYSTNNEKLLIYKYQDNGSLLTLFEAYLACKIIFPWNLRLSIAIGIARSLAFIYQNGNSTIPHGNIKPSNILLNKDMQPVLSEYGHTRFLDPQSQLHNINNGYTAPEMDLTEKSDVFSFGIICLELLTGKIVENSGVDLPKWVRAMVREEWTGEVFDKEIIDYSKFAFALLNVSLKCVANVPQERPTFEEVLVKMEEIVYAQEEEEASPLSPSYSSF